MTDGSAGLGSETMQELHETIDEWREQADELIHEGENEYVEGRGGQLAECARQLERIVDDAE